MCKFMISFINLLVIGIFSCLLPFSVFAKETEATSDKYQFDVIDEPDYLTPDQEEILKEKMKSTSQHCNLVIYIFAPDQNRKSENETIQYTKERYWNSYGYENGTAFTIDMSTRYLEVVNFEDNVDKINNYEATMITDSVYSHASNGDYFSCCYVAISRIDDALGGVKIPQNMRVVTNLLIAFLVALILNFFLLNYLSKPRNAKNNKWIDSAKVDLSITPIKNSQTGHKNISHELGSFEGIVLTKNVLGKCIHLIVFLFILIIEVGLEVLTSSGGSSSGGGRSGGGSSGGGGRSGGGGHRF